MSEQDSNRKRRLERRLKQIEDLSPKLKQQLLSIIDTFIEAEQNRTGSRS